MRDILWLIRNTLSSTFRQKKNIIMYLCLPLIGIFVAILAYGGEQPMTLHIGVASHDQSYITDDTIKFLNDLDNVKITKINDSEVQDKITSGALDGVITFKSGYSGSVLNGDPGHIQITSIKGAQVTSFVKSYLYRYIDNISAIAKAAGGDQAAFKTMYHGFQGTGFKLKAHSLADTSKNKDMAYQTIGFLIMIMLMSAGNLSEIILLEKENRTYFRLLSSPINARKYIFSNIVVNMIVMTAQILITLTVMTTIFHIDINVPFWEAAGVMLIFALIAIGLSLVTVAFSNSRSAASGLQNLIVMPTVMLSGCFWPVEVMPESVQKIADFLPQRWALDTLTKLQDGDVSHIYLNIMILFAFAIAFFLIAIYKFGRNNDTRNFV
ncbi:ABC-2 type transport system permease protein [Scopulibacillus darangshiensis]|uniref:Transport permease protein n=1 Tax=Scopulibacillus darangshiensis TaxID=442528 RepID=A0A4R2P5F9_9BACL|nr:ABC transporter permease [Scopulibacillus darangshiensis]TCP29015.1 ABC-2 type transport system permease protein [Scopulibacillus darangshiensis]